MRCIAPPERSAVQFKRANDPTGKVRKRSSCAASNVRFPIPPRLDFAIAPPGCFVGPFGMNLRAVALTVLAAYLGAVNVVAFHTFAHDKVRSVRRDRRTPEKTLLALTAAGGTLGALAARSMFRHKTRKQPFRTFFWLIVAAQVVVVAAVISTALWGR
jgi:uncharacterized membrane protein YsdA (DUF1294 family)